MENLTTRDEVIIIEVDGNYYSCIEWINLNSVGNIRVRLLPTGDNVNKYAEFTFSNSDDAILFRIKYKKIITDEFK